jgi:hypothetical protein
VEGSIVAAVAGTGGGYFGEICSRPIEAVGCWGYRPHSADGGSCKLGTRFCFGVCGPDARELAIPALALAIEPLGQIQGRQNGVLFLRV